MLTNFRTKSQMVLFSEIQNAILDDVWLTALSITNLNTARGARKRINNFVKGFALRDFDHKWEWGLFWVHELDAGTEDVRKKSTAFTNIDSFYLKNSHILWKMLKNSHFGFFLYSKQLRILDNCHSEYGSSQSCLRQPRLEVGPKKAGYVNQTLQFGYSQAFPFWI